MKNVSNQVSNQVCDQVRMVELVKDIVSRCRELRNKNNLKPRESLPLFLSQTENNRAIFEDPGLSELLIKSASLCEIKIVNDQAELPTGQNLLSFVIGTDKYFLMSSQTVDVAEEKQNLEKDLIYQQGFVESIRKKLDNEKFVSNARPDVVEKERQKMADGLKRIEMIRESLERLGVEN